MSEHGSSLETHAVGSTKLFVMVWIWLAAITFLEVFLAYEKLQSGSDAYASRGALDCQGDADHFVLHALEIRKDRSHAAVDSCDDFLHLHDFYFLYARWRAAYAEPHGALRGAAGGLN